MVVMFVMCFVGFTVIGLVLYAVGRDLHMLLSHARRLSDEVRTLRGEFSCLDDALTSDVEGANLRIDDLRDYCDTRFARSRSKRGSKLFPEIPPPPPSPKLDNGSPYEQLTLQLDDNDVDSDDDTLRPEDN